MLCICSLRVAALGAKLEKLKLNLNIAPPAVSIPPLLPALTPPALKPNFPPSIDAKAAAEMPKLTTGLDPKIQAALDLAAAANFAADAKAALKVDLTLPSAKCMMNGFAASFKGSGLADMLKSMGVGLLENLLPLKELADAVRTLDNLGLDPYSPELPEQLAEMMDKLAGLNDALAQSAATDPLTPALVAAVAAQEQAAVAAAPAAAAMAAATEAAQKAFGVNLTDPDAVAKLAGPLGAMSSNMGSMPSLEDLLSLAEALLILKTLEAIEAVADAFGVDLTGDGGLSDLMNAVNGLGGLGSAISAGLGGGAGAGASGGAGLGASAGAGASAGLAAGAAAGASASAGASLGAGASAAAGLNALAAAGLPDLMSGMAGPPMLLSLLLLILRQLERLFGSSLAATEPCS